MEQSELSCALCDRQHVGHCPEPERDRRIGQVIDGKYHILRRLACGGMGSVYEARHAVVGRHFAVKFLHEQYANQSCMVQRFLREAQAAGSIASEHIIGVLDYGTSEGTPYLVMELVQGEDLREVLAREQRLAPGRAVRIIIDACRGLAVAHERGLVHRDLKPANICITTRSDGSEAAKVIDFGVAKLRDGADLSEEGTLIGTVGYMAPEQLTDQKELDGRADVYALGVILYQALAGRPPHVCSRSELLYRIVSVDPKPLDEVCSGLPEGLSEVVSRALCRNKARRQPGVADLARELEPFAERDVASVPRAVSRRAGAAERASLGLGTAETEIESAPTWVALAPTPNPKASRNCKQLSVPESKAREEFCRHPPGAAPMPVAAPHINQLSQRALLLSVGALALSVVAMTTMFIFVYSHGSGALESAAHSSGRPQQAAEPPSQRPPLPARTDSAPAAARQPVPPEAPARPNGSDPAASRLADATGSCPKRPAPLYRASVVELSADGESGIYVQRQALQAADPGDCD
jgi:serine/threonine protein kinase